MRRRSTASSSRVSPRPVPVSPLPSRPEETEELLRALELTPRRGRGQNFLMDHGYARALAHALAPPPGAPVTVAGQATRTLARVSMDMLFVDLTTVSAEIGASVVLMGAGGPALESLATRLDTISYELSCRMQMRVPRQLVS